MALKKFGADLPKEVADRFDQFVESKGLVKRRAIIAALDWIRAAPPELRDLLMSGDVKGAAEWMISANDAMDSANSVPAFDVLGYARLAPSEQSVAQDVSQMLDSVDAQVDQATGKPKPKKNRKKRA